MPEVRRKKRRTFELHGDAHELTFSCFKRLPLLGPPAIRSEFLQYLQISKTRLGYELWAYVVMPTHVHMLVWPGKNGPKVAQILRDVKQPFSQEMGRQGYSVMTDKGRRFWTAGGGYDRNVYSDKVVQASLDYIHMNPVVAGLCENVIDYPWSSAAAYLGLAGSELEPDFAR